MPVLFVITTLQNLDIFKIDGVISVSKMSLKKTPCISSKRNRKIINVIGTRNGSEENSNLVYN